MASWARAVGSEEAKEIGPKGTRSRRGGRHAAAVLALLLAACSAPATPWPVQRPATVAPAPAAGPRLVIVDLSEHASEAPGWVVVVGKLENRGARATEEIRITVSALGAGDRVVTRSPGVARRQRVAPGARTEFAAVFERLPEVEAYHVKTLAW